MRDEVILGTVAVVCITAMTIACFYITGQDGTVLAAAAGAIGTVIGVVLGRSELLAKKTP